MCGIVGIVGDMNHASVKAFKTMLFLDTIRGKDSTGIAAIPTAYGEDTDPLIVKALGTAEKFLDTKEVQSTLTYSKMGFIGHNRAATVGVKTAENAHPFRHEHITGVHNGTLEYGATDLLSPDKDFGTDSETIYWAIAHKGLEWTLARLHGAFALAWFDAKERTMNFIRNSERPFWTGFTENDRQMVFGSDKDLLNLAIRYGKMTPVAKWHEMDTGLHCSLKIPDSFTEFPFTLDHTKQVDYSKLIGSEPNVWGGWEKKWSSYGGSKFSSRTYKPPVVVGGTDTKETKTSRKKSKARAKIITKKWNQFNDWKHTRLEQPAYVQSLFLGLPKSSDGILAIEGQLDEMGAELSDMQWDSIEDNSVASTTKLITKMKQEVRLLDITELWNGVLEIDASIFPQLKEGVSSGYRDLTVGEYKNLLEESPCSGCGAYLDPKVDLPHTVLPIGENDETFLCSDCQQNELFSSYVR